MKYQFCSDMLNVSLVFTGQKNIELLQFAIMLCKKSIKQKNSAHRECDLTIFHKRHREEDGTCRQWPFKWKERKQKWEVIEGITMSY